jgi:protein phosphatase
MLTWAHVGDSRLWLIRDGKAHQLTEDQSIAGVLYHKGSITEEQFDKGDYNPGILSFLGAPKEYFEIEVGSQKLYPGDFVVLTTDGLHVEPFRRDLPQLVRQGADFIVTYAMAHGSTDNATIILVEA